MVSRVTVSSEFHRSVERGSVDGVRGHLRCGDHLGDASTRESAF